MSSRARLVAFCRKMPSITYDQLRQTWLYDVGSRFATLEIAQKNILVYEQGHIDQTALQRLVQDGFSVPDFDGFAVLEAESFEKIQEVLASEEWKTNVGPIEGSVIDITSPEVWPCASVETIGESGVKGFRYVVFDGGNINRETCDHFSMLQKLIKMSLLKMVSGDAGGNKSLVFIETDSLEPSSRPSALSNCEGKILPAIVETIIRK
ncbi:hypothetical protein D9758_016233 [Tetrapyrgos nigripes]|uniref:Uncharacterized protein n=1 Tax=Tetrapyrgos nigripes TaxID=182062 RepID=A0A8H5FFV2_9AGAR|nr:hypothetical protein D9758_016233 [Tetrapyrgos nigripes]